ncbi:TetR/AcrR family transcriptional regulator [Sphingobium estronivorans]|uniref:TetR/AcrR family transcriptional regulator n=1 Tax=Sphingobium estronivorans TaxID=1577690 RepID=UPI001238CC20|nr:TetR family transcriptional regulator [Sphingobium estronivorans]
MVSNQVDHILAATMRLCLDQGLGAVTMRSVAAAAGVTSSAIVYHFKTRERLLVALLDHIENAVAASRSRLIDAFDEEQLAFAGPAACIMAILHRLLDEQGLAIIALSEIDRFLRDTEAEQAARTIMCRAWDRADRFWQNLPVIADEDREGKAIWAAAAQGMIPLVMLDRTPVLRDARIARIIARLADRLARREVQLQPPWSPPEPLARAVRPTGKQQIVDATIRLSGKGGIEALTHRKIAAEAGLSVASTTYFYPTKDDIVADAAYDVQARAMNAVVDGSVPPPMFMSRIMLDERQEERPEMATLTAFMTAAIRSPERGQFATAVRRVRGLDGIRWLAARGYRQTDRLDGILWAATSVFLVQKALLQPAAERAAILDDVSDVWLTRLFG